MQVEVSEIAQTKLLELGLGKEKFLRIGAVPGGCSGVSYDATIDDILEQGDAVVFESGDLRIVSDEFSAPHVAGLAVDYSDQPERSGFRLTNRNAVSACGHGHDSADDETAPDAAAGGGCAGCRGCG